MTLKDKKVLIVGATSDIGMVIASYCKKEGAEVIVTGRNTERLLKIEKEGIETTVLDILNEKDETARYRCEKKRKLSIF